MTFQRYESRPITRLAYEIQETDAFWLIEPNTYRIALEDGPMDFKAYEEPVAGDFIVYLPAEDTYHCRRDVFIERNIVPEEDAA